MIHCGDSGLYYLLPKSADFCLFQQTVNLCEHKPRTLTPLHLAEAEISFQLFQLFQLWLGCLKSAKHIHSSEVSQRLGPSTYAEFDALCSFPLS